MNRSILNKYGLRILNDTYIIENIVQDAFLKLWEFRNTITTLEHAERFLKQSVKWECHSYFRNSGSRFHRRMVQLDASDNYGGISGAYFTDTEESVYERRANEATEAIGKVCHGREKEVMELHFIKGLTHTRIAERYHLSVHTVTLILDKGKLRLKAMLVTAPGQGRATGKRPVSDLMRNLDPIGGLSAEQNLIYQLRLTGKYDFDRIAAMLQLPVAYVQLQYVNAWKIADCQKKKKKQTGHTGRRNAGVIMETPLLSA